MKKSRTKSKARHVDAELVEDIFKKLAKISVKNPELRGLLIDLGKALDPASPREVKPAKKPKVKKEKTGRTSAKAFRRLVSRLTLSNGIRRKPKTQSKASDAIAMPASKAKQTELLRKIRAEARNITKASTPKVAGQHWDNINEAIEEWVSLGCQINDERLMKRIGPLVNKKTEHVVLSASAAKLFDQVTPTEAVAEVKAWLEGKKLLIIGGKDQGPKANIRTQFGLQQVIWPKTAQATGSKLDRLKKLICDEKPALVVIQDFAKQSTWNVEIPLICKKEQIAYVKLTTGLSPNKIATSVLEHVPSSLLKE